MPAGEVVHPDHPSAEDLDETLHARLMLEAPRSEVVIDTPRAPVAPK
jgi:hypothetical protein